MTTDQKVCLELFLAVSAVCFAFGFWIRRKERVPHAWPKSSGVVVTSKTVRQYAGQGIDEVFPLASHNRQNPTVIPSFC